MRVEEAIRDECLPTVSAAWLVLRTRTLTAAILGPRRLELH